MGLVALHTFSRIPALSWADEVDDDAGAFLSDAGVGTDSGVRGMSEVSIAGLFYLTSMFILYIWSMFIFIYLVDKGNYV
jgi:hypothetical protein